MLDKKGIKFMISLAQKIERREEKRREEKRREEKRREEKRREEKRREEKRREEKFIIALSKLDPFILTKEESYVKLLVTRFLCYSYKPLGE
ncbi:hypothetical protein THII_2685 [Thioploca ingrica]|uniref:Uncharacterized protein n=1 Tax=Thioploca ingrica TaxID=40754 RepID=A0A090AM60_9GAMM|nr:hypothetical protein THII_2685 [Thioploca ingrica]